jgi:hypothetical protein
MAGYRIIVWVEAPWVAPPPARRERPSVRCFAGAQWGLFAVSQGRVVQVELPEAIVIIPPGKRPLAEADAIDIWIARWLRIRRKELLARYGCDPRRLYEIWEEKRFAGSRDKARAVFAERYPGLVNRIDYGRHRTIPRKPPADLQPGLFD